MHRVTPTTALPRWGEGKENITVNSLAPIGGEGARRAGEGALAYRQTVWQNWHHFVVHHLGVMGSSPDRPGRWRKAGEPVQFDFLPSVAIVLA